MTASFLFPRVSISIFTHGPPSPPHHGVLGSTLSQPPSTHDVFVFRYDSGLPISPPKAQGYSPKLRIHQSADDPGHQTLASKGSHTPVANSPAPLYLDPRSSVPRRAMLPNSRAAVSSPPLASCHDGFRDKVTFIAPLSSRRCHFRPRRITTIDNNERQSKPLTPSCHQLLSYIHTLTLSEVSCKSLHAFS